MAAVSGQGTTYNLPNFVGELFRVTPSDTPFLSMIGGLTGGRSVGSKSWTWQTVDNNSPSQPAIVEGADPTYAERDRTEYSNVVQIFQYGVEVSYTKRAATGQLGPYAADRGWSIMGNQPVNDELAFQLQLKLERAARDVDYSFLWGSYQLPANNSTGRKTRGLRNAITTNVTAAGTVVANCDFDFTGGASEDLWTSASAHGMSTGDEFQFTSTTDTVDTDAAPFQLNTPYWAIVKSATTFQLASSPENAAASTPIEGTSDSNANAWQGLATKDLTKAHVDGLLRNMYGSGAPFRRPVILCGPYVKQQITSLYGYAPESRNVGGLNIEQIETDFAQLGVVIDRNMLASDLYVVDLSVCSPVFLNIPDKGHFFAEPMAQTGAAWKWQLYGEVGLEYGPELWHGKITGLTTDA